MNKIIGTFYKGNSKQFGNINWNTGKYNNNDDDIINTSKSQQIILNKENSIYNPNYSKYQKYNHLSPNLIRMQYFNNYLKEFEFRRNIHLNDYINKGIYNVYQGAEDPLLERRKNVQKRLEQVKEKLLNEEMVKMEQKMKKVDEENKIIDDLILEQEYDVEYNKDRDDIAIHLMDNFDDKDFEKIYDDKKKNEDKKSFKSISNNDSMLILSRTHSTSKSSGIDLLGNEKDENDRILEQKKRDTIIKNNLRSSLKMNDLNKTINNLNKIKETKESKNNIITEKYQHTDILKIISNMDKYSIPIDNVTKELVNQSKKPPYYFDELYNEIVNLKEDFGQKIKRYYNENKNDMNILNEVLEDLRIKKNFMEIEADIYKPHIDKIIEDEIQKYKKKRIEEDFNYRLNNENNNMVNEYDLNIRLNERAKYANKLANNICNEIENRDNIYIKSTKKDNGFLSNLSSINSKNENNNSKKINNKEDESKKNNAFPALEGIDELIKKNEKEDISQKSKIKVKKKRKKKNVIVKDLGIVEDDYILHKDIKNNKLNERKETIIEKIEQNNDET
jgi:hypothetical protein